jgi:hypothetical protein
VAALNELVQAIRWVWARHRTPVFELNGPTVSTCSAYGTDGEPNPGAPARGFQCTTCGSERGRASNAALWAWRPSQQGRDERVNSYATLSGTVDATARQARMSWQAAVSQGHAG